MSGFANLSKRRLEEEDKENNSPLGKKQQNLDEESDAKRIKGDKFVQDESRPKFDTLIKPLQPAKTREADVSMEQSDISIIEEKIESRTSQVDIVEVEDKKTDEEHLQKFQQLFHDANSLGTCSVSGEASDLPTQIGLYVKEMNEFVSQPLNKHQADEMILRCAKRDEVDTCANNDVYRLEPAQFEIKNPAWDTKLQILMKSIVLDLGCRGEFVASLDHLKIYKSGGRVNKCKSFGKNQFATVVLQLPSNHTGGELKVFNDGAVEHVDFGQKAMISPFSVQYAAFHSDLEYEILPVTEGYNLALMYSLCWADENGENVVIRANSVLEMSKLLEAISKGEILNARVNRLACLLNGNYTPNPFESHGVAALDQTDLRRYHLLKRANDLLPVEHQFDIYIAFLSFFEKYNDDWDGRGCYYEELDAYEDNRGENSIKKWYDVNGAACLDHVSVRFLTSILDPSSDATGKVLSLKQFESHMWKKYHEFVENKKDWTSVNCVMMTSYPKYALAFWPKKDNFKAIVKISLEAGLNFLLGAVEAKVDPVDAAFVRNLKIVVLILTKNRDWCCENAAKMLRLLTYSSELNLTRYYLKNANEMIGCCDAKLLANLIARFGWDKLEESCLKSTFVAPKSGEALANICSIIKELVAIDKQAFALSLYQKTILPILDNHSHFMKLVEENTPSWSYYSLEKRSSTALNMFASLANAIALFGDVHASSMAKLAEATSLLDSKHMGALLKTLVDDNSPALAYPLIHELFERRLNFLVESTREQPQFTLSMPNAHIPNHPRVQSFLASAKTDMVYEGIFDGIKHARSFVSKYQGLQRTHSTSMRSGGIGKRAFVEIKKTNAFFEKQVENFKQNLEELERIRKFLAQPV